MTAKATRATVVNGKTYIYREGGTLVPAKSKMDFAALDAMTDEEITAAAEADPDARPMTDEEWAKATVVFPPKRRIGLRLDADVLTWFQSQGKGYQTRMNAVLRRYVAVQRKVG